MCFFVVVFFLNYLVVFSVFVFFNATLNSSVTLQSIFEAYLIN